MASTTETTPENSPAIDQLPPEIITEIVARVASSCLTDLFHCKLSCKALLDLAKEREVLQRVSLDELPFIMWFPTQHANDFLHRCQESQNPEALFRLGVWQYFSCVVVEEGMASLDRAAMQGHMAAAYVLSLLLLCNGDLERERRGVTLMMSIIERFKGRGIVECRKKLKDAMSWIWMNNGFILQTRKPRFSCELEEEHGGVRRGWKELYFYDEEWEDRVVCQKCRCQREIDFFFSLLPDSV